MIFDLFNYVYVYTNIKVSRRILLNSIVNCDTYERESPDAWIEKINL